MIVQFDRYVSSFSSTISNLLPLGMTAKHLYTHFVDIEDFRNRKSMLTTHVPEEFAVSTDVNGNFVCEWVHCVVKTIPGSLWGVFDELFLRPIAISSNVLVQPLDSIPVSIKLFTTIFLRQRRLLPRAVFVVPLFNSFWIRPTQEGVASFIPFAVLNPASAFR